MDQVYPEDQEALIAQEVERYDARYADRIKKPFFYHAPKSDHAFLSALQARYDMRLGDSLLDLGCGNGIYAQMWRTRGLKVTGVDLSSKGVEHCQKTWPTGIEWVCGDAFKLDRPKQFDFAWCYFFSWFCAFERHKDMQEGVRTLMSYLKPGGRLFWVWHSDLTGTRLEDGKRFAVPNWTLAQAMEMFQGFEVEGYATDSPGHTFRVLGQRALNKWVTKVSLGWTAFKRGSWDRSRLIVVAKA